MQSLPGTPPEAGREAEERFLTLTSIVPDSYFYPILEMRKQTTDPPIWETLSDRPNHEETTFRAREVLI